MVVNGTPLPWQQPPPEQPQQPPPHLGASLSTLGGHHSRLLRRSAARRGSRRGGRFWRRAGAGLMRRAPICANIMGGTARRLKGRRGDGSDTFSGS